jgi:membrane-bound lytic murein transglycosylase D
MKLRIAWWTGLCALFCACISPQQAKAARTTTTIKTSSPALTRDLNQALRHPRFRRELMVQRRKYWSYTRINISRRGLFQGMISSTLRYYKLPLELIMVAGAESSYKARVLSRSNATGVWQFIPRTGRRYGLRITPWVDERRHVQKSTIAAARYLRDLFRRYKRWDLAIASYNCGERMMDRSLRRCPNQPIWSMIGNRRCRVPQQTANYISRIFALIYYLHNPSQFRRKLRVRKPLVLAKVWAPSPVSLPAFAKGVGLSLKRLWRDNSELSSWATPPGQPYPLLVPPRYVARARRYLGNLHSLPYRLQSIPVSRRTDLRSVAEKVGLTAETLRQLNRLRNYSIPKSMHYLLLPMPKGKKAWSLLEQGTLVGLSQEATQFMRAHPLARLAHDAKRSRRSSVPWCINCVATAANLTTTAEPRRTYRTYQRNVQFRGIRYQRTLDWTRVVISLSGEVRLEEGKAKASRSLRLPQRFFVDITPCKPDSWWYKAGFSVGNRHVQRLRVGRTNLTTRIVLELKAQQKVRVTVLSNPVRIVMDVARKSMPPVPTNRFRLPSRKPTRLVGRALRSWKRRYRRR